MGEQTGAGWQIFTSSAIWFFDFYRDFSNELAMREVV